MQRQIPNGSGTKQECKKASHQVLTCLTQIPAEDAAHGENMTIYFINRAVKSSSAGQRQFQQELDPKLTTQRSDAAEA